MTATRCAFRPYLALAVWVETPRMERLRRGLERDGDGALALWTEWMAQEDEHAAREQPQRHARVLVNGTQRELEAAGTRSLLLQALLVYHNGSWPAPYQPQSFSFSMKRSQSFSPTRGDYFLLTSGYRPLVG